jgi:hypothetical protein
MFSPNRRCSFLPLSCRGPDTLANLQGQTVQAARAKDKWEQKSGAR